jgi:thiol-disulfide isomerase/thioredoxin
MTTRRVRSEVIRAPELAGAGGWINTAEPLSIAALRGKIVLLDFWTFCCINCLHIIEELRPLEERYPNDLVIVGVHSPKFPEEHDHEAVVRAVARHRITHPVLDDPDMITWSRYAVRAWPTLVLVDSEGIVRGTVSGEGYGPALLQAVGQLIDEGRGNGTLREGTSPVRLAGTAAAGGVARDTGMLAFPGKIAATTDADGGVRLAIADTGHDRIVVARLDGNAATVEQSYDGLHEPQGLYFDGARLIATNCLTGEVLAIDRNSGAQRVLASEISSPWDVAAWQGGIAVAEAGRHRLRFIADPDRGGEAEILAGTSAEGLQDGPAQAAVLAQPSGLAVSGDALFFLDSETSSLRRLDADGVVSTLVGEGLFDWGTDDGPGPQARLQHPLGLAAAADGGVYIADTFNSRLRLWQDGALTTLPVAGLHEPGGLCLLPDGRLAVADTNHHRITLVDPANAAVETLRLSAPGEQNVATTERTLAAGAAVRLSLTLDLAGDDLDPSTGPPVRVSISADPPALLAAGPRVWALDALPAEVEIRTGAADVGAGVLTIELRAASCLGDVCRLHSRSVETPITLAADGATTVTL